MSGFFQLEAVNGQDDLGREHNRATERTGQARMRIITDMKANLSTFVLTFLWFALSVGPGFDVDCPEEKVPILILHCCRDIPILIKLEQFITEKLKSIL